MSGEDSRIFKKIRVTIRRVTSFLGRWTKGFFLTLKKDRTRVNYRIRALMEVRVEMCERIDLKTYHLVHDHLVKVIIELLIQGI